MNSQSISRVAIIGTAGRGADISKLASGHFLRMFGAALQILRERLSLTRADTHLVSGGAAWADHCAVALYLSGEADSLRLSFPCAFDVSGGQYHDSGVSDWRINPGGSANRYLRDFKRVAGVDAGREIAEAIRGGAEVHIGKGFHDRNSTVADADAIIALTFGHGPLLQDGGTADTMRKYLERFEGTLFQPKAFHVDLNSWCVFERAEVPKR